MTPAYSDNLATLYLGDCVEVMSELPTASVDAVVTDPPYGLEFMGKEWDRDVPHAWVPEALRVLKPGAHVLAFGGTRTFHRLTCALEDAGFEIRDCLSWLYGSGFPKSLDVSKAIDKAAGAEREVVGSAKGKGGENLNRLSRPQGHDSENARGVGAYGQGAKQITIDIPITAPATDNAKRWQGWGTALKPSWEPIVLARKPLAEPNVAANVTKHGTGAINVDGCRITTIEPGGRPGLFANKNGQAKHAYSDGLNGSKYVGLTTLGRWPANLVLDEDAARMLDEQSGECGAAAPIRGDEPSVPAKGDVAYGFRRRVPGPFHGDTGGASRFFYTAKADAEDRDGSKHPTVKPVALMKWLVTLVTPPGGLVLDPFAGSGTTVYAARELGFRVIGIDREREYITDATRRLRQGVLF